MAISENLYESSLFIFLIYSISFLNEKTFSKKEKTLQKQKPTTIEKNIYNNK